MKEQENILFKKQFKIKKAPKEGGKRKYKLILTLKRSCFNIEMTLFLKPIQAPGLMGNLSNLL